jgi:glutamine synthetase
VRSAAPDCNPYLEIFILLQVGLHGIENPWKYKEILDKREKLPWNIYDAIRYFKKSPLIKEFLWEENQEKFANLKEMVANRCPKDLWTRIKKREIVDHHEITNQYLWGEF